MLVTRKHAAAATERNRIKRCIREAFRLEQEALGPVDLLVRPPYDVRPTAQMIMPTSRAAGRTEQEMITTCMRAAVRGYQWFIRPVLPPACRFHPELLGVRRRSARAPRHVARRLARRETRLPLRPLASGRLRPGAVVAWIPSASSCCSSSASRCSCSGRPGRRSIDRSRLPPRRPPSASRRFPPRLAPAAKPRRQRRRRRRASAVPAAAPAAKGETVRVTHRPVRGRDRYARRHAEALRAAQAQGLGRPDQEPGSARPGAQIRSAERHHARRRAEPPDAMDRYRERLRLAAGRGQRARCA